MTLQDWNGATIIGHFRHLSNGDQLEIPHVRHVQMDATTIICRQSEQQNRQRKTQTDKISFCQKDDW